MNDPREDLSYKAKIHLSFEIDGLCFDSYLKYNFEVSGYPKLNSSELEEVAIESFKEEYSDAISEFDIKIEIESINKF